MSDLVLFCGQCGNRMRVPEYAMGTKGRCSKCHSVLDVTSENTQPFASSPVRQAAPVAVAPQSLNPAVEGFISNDSPPRVAGGACARCGKPFRGEWDRYETDIGVICHICSRLSSPEGYTVVQGEVITSQPLPPQAFHHLPPLNESEDDSPKIPAFAKGHPELFRAALWTAAILVMLLGVYVALFSEPENMAEYSHGGEMANAPEQDLPASVYIIVLGICFAMRLLPVFLSLYLVLHMAKMLPSDDMAMNLASVLVSTIIINVLLMIPIFGFLFVLAYLWMRLDFPFHLIVTYLFLCILSSILAKTLAAFLLGALGGIAIAM